MIYASREYRLVSQLLADNNHRVSAFGRIAQEVNMVAYTVGRVAVMASAVYCTRCIQIESCRVDRGGSSACTFQSRLCVLAHLVYANDKYYVLRSEGNGSHSVAIAVDINDDTVFANCVCA